MATLDAVARLALVLPETSEVPTKDGLRQWRVKDKLLAWERPLRPADLRALGERAPRGTILGVCVPDLETKDAMISARGEIYFTTPHFDGYAMVLVVLGKIPAAELADLLLEAWVARAPPRLVAQQGRPLQTLQKTRAPAKGGAARTRAAATSSPKTKPAARKTAATKTGRAANAAARKKPGATKKAR